MRVQGACEGLLLLPELQKRNTGNEARATAALHAALHLGYKLSPTRGSGRLRLQRTNRSDGCSFLLTLRCCAAGCRQQTGIGGMAGGGGGGGGGGDCRCSENRIAHQILYHVENAAGRCSSRDAANG
jgi:hypothetical protein